MPTSATLLNKKGLTLIELLLAISVSTIIISLISYVLVHTVDQFNGTIDHSSLRQEANILSETIEQAFMEGGEGDIINIETDSSGHLEIGNTSIPFEKYEVYIDITTRGEKGDDNTFSTLAGKDCDISCADTNIASDSTGSINADNYKGYTMEITLYSASQPCDSYEFVTNISKLEGSEQQ